MSFWNALGAAFGGLFGLGTSLITSNQAVNAQKRANNANMKINRENIAAAQEMYNRQESFLREMYERDLAYNDPKAQRERMEAAGLNPWTSDFNVGGASSPSAPSYSQPSMIPMQAAKPLPILSAQEGAAIGMSFGQLGLLEAQRDKTRAEAASAWSDANFKDQMNTLSVARGIAEIDGLSEKAKGMMIDNYIKQNTSQYAIQSAKNDAQYSFQRVRNAALDADLKQANLPALSQLAQVQLDAAVLENLQKKYNIELTKQNISTAKVNRAYIGQQISNLVLTGQLTVKQIEKVYQETLSIEKDRLNIPWLTEQQKQDMAKAMVDSQVNAAVLSGLELDPALEKSMQSKKYINAPDWYRSSKRAIDDFLPFGSLLRK